MTHPAAEAQPGEIRKLVETMQRRSGLTFVAVRDAMLSYLQAHSIEDYNNRDEYDKDRFSRLFRRPDARLNPRHRHDVRALLHVFATLSQERRCLAGEAFHLLRLAHIEEDFKLFKDLFPEQEARAAWHEYLEAADAPVAKVTRGQFVKPSYPSLFVGRGDDVARLRQRLGLTGAADWHPLTIVRGWPGVGKTTLINRLLYDEETLLWNAFPDGVLWASLGPDGDLLRTLKNWARQLGAVRIEPLRRLEDVVDELRTWLEGKHVLLAVDDVWNDEQGGVIKSLATGATTLLLTTRFTELANLLADTPDAVCLLDVLSDAAALQVLSASAPSAFEAYKDDMEVLVKTLEGLPLALRVAGRLIEEEHVLGYGSVPELIRDLQADFGLYANKSRTERFDEALGKTPTISMLFRRSVAMLAPQDRQAFACVGWFSPKPARFDLRALAGVCALEDPKATARALVGRGLMEPLGEGRFQMHYTLAMYARHLTNTGLAELDQG